MSAEKRNKSFGSLSEAIQQASSLMTKNQFHEAIDLWNEIIKKYSNEMPVGVFARLASAYRKIGSIERSQEIILKQINDGHANLDIYLEGVENHAHEKNYPEAILLAESARSMPLDQSQYFRIDTTQVRLKIRSGDFSSARNQALEMSDKYYGEAEISAIKKLLGEISIKEQFLKEPDPWKRYWNDRKNYVYIHVTKRIINALALSANVIVDIGSNRIPTLDNFPDAQFKYSVDPMNPYEGPGVIPVREDFFTWQPKERIQFGTCMQVMEHVDDPTTFALKILEVCEVALISVPYMERSGLNPGHIQNMIDYETVVGWFQREPNYHYVATELSGDRRIICIFDTTSNKKFPNLHQQSETAYAFRFRWSLAEQTQKKNTKSIATSMMISTADSHYLHTEAPLATGPRVSVVIPNYNYENYLEERINSIIDQTYRPHEIIFLDDCSSDDSLEVARPLLERSGIPFKIIPNTTNHGVYRQWLRGISEASGDWVWLAEADDVAELDFLSSLTDKAGDDVNLVYCQSRRIDGDGTLTAPNNLAHTNDMDPKRWLKDYVEIGVREVVDTLAYRNSIPNASAALLRKSAISGVDELLLKHRYCGDWLLYAYMLQQGKIAFISRSLNHFRRHEKSVTRVVSQKLAYLKELANFRQFVADEFPLLPRHIERLNWFLDRDYKIENVAKNTKCSVIAQQLNAVNSRVAKRKRFLFITTNNGSYFGGSEILWRETALKLRDEGHDVFVLIKKWDPIPSFFPEFERAGIKLFFKDEEPFKEILEIAPDLVVVSIGDQDEGIEYYPALTKHHLPYVIINQLTKEKRFWPIRMSKMKRVKNGYLNAERVFFTCHNNHRVMQDRLGCEVKNAEIHTNPYHIDRNLVPPFPDTSNGLQIAVPSKILFIHKGHDLLAEVMGAEHWKARDITLNIYGIGPDRENLEELAKTKGISCFKFHGRVSDIGEIWKLNHAFVLPSRMEGLPIMLVSGMLSARVPIATDIGGHAEVVDDGRSGFIARDPEVEALDHAMERAYAARDNWCEIGQQARKDILEYLPEDPVEDFVGKLFRVINES